MQGERAVAVGLSLTLHACLLGIVISRLVLAPSLTPKPPITVSFDAPPPYGESVDAASPQLAPASEPAALPAMAPLPIGPVPLTPTLSDPAVPAFNDKGRAPELRPLDPAPSSHAIDRLGPDLQALLPSAGRAVEAASLGLGVKPVAGEDQLSSARMAAEPLPPSALPAEAEGPAMIPTIQAAAEAPPAAQQPETAPLSQPPALTATSQLRPRVPETRGGTGVGPAVPALALPTQILADTPPPPTVPQTASATEVPLTVPLPLPASASPVVEDARLQPVPDAGREAGALAPQGVEAQAPPTATEVPRETVIASLAPVEPGKAIDLGPTDVPLPPTATERAQQIRAFVDSYDGGPCFFASIRQVSALSAEIESFSTMPSGFQQFDRALKTSTGIEATVSGQRIWSAQCPAVEYLHKLPHDAESGPTLELERRALERGDALSGTIHGAAGQPLRLFVVAETGAVTDISDAVSERGGSPSFSFRPRPMAAGGPFPQILVLVAGATTLPLHPVTVDDIFQPLTASKGSAYTVAAKMFLVTR